MRVFVYEYTCGGGMAGRACSQSLRTEGWAMLAALLSDFACVPGVRVETLLDDQSGPAPEGCLVHRVRWGEEEQAFREAARAAAFTLVVAPEFDNLLATRCRWVVEEKSCLLGPTPAAIGLTADKLALARHLLDREVATPESWSFQPVQPTPPVPFPAVCKPRFGAGSCATFLIQAPRDLTKVSAEAEGGELLLQPFVPGQPASVAFLLGLGRQVALPAATQRLSDDGRFQYLGGKVPLPPPLSDRATQLAQRAVGTVPGLKGYIGVDVVLGSAGDGSQDSVIEINPRLTTSFVGLRALAETNLADAMLRIVQGQEPLPMRWRTGYVKFRADGTVSRPASEMPGGSAAFGPRTTDY